MLPYPIIFYLLCKCTYMRTPPRHLITTRTTMEISPATFYVILDVLFNCAVYWCCNHVIGYYPFESELSSKSTKKNHAKPQNLNVNHIQKNQVTWLHRSKDRRPQMIIPHVGDNI